MKLKSDSLFHRSTTSLKTRVATVSGVTRNGAEKSLVTKFVSDIHGVTQVASHMTVAGVAAAQ